MTGLLITAGVIALLIFIAVMPITVPLRVAFEEKHGDIHFTIKYLFIKIQLVPPRVTAKEIKKDEKPKEEEEPKKRKITDRDIAETIEVVKKLLEIAQALVDDLLNLLRVLMTKDIIIHDFDLELRLGTGDPMSTGIAIGAADSVLYPLIGFLDNTMRLQSYKLNIIPDWNKTVFSGSFYIRLSINLARILRLVGMLIPMAIKALTIWFRKGH